MADGQEGLGTKEQLRPIVILPHLSRVQERVRYELVNNEAVAGVMSGQRSTLARIGTLSWRRQTQRCCAIGVTAVRCQELWAFSPLCSYSATLYKKKFCHPSGKKDNCVGPHDHASAVSHPHSFQKVRSFVAIKDL